MQYFDPWPRYSILCGLSRYWCFPPLDVFPQRPAIPKSWYHPLWHLAWTLICLADCSYQIQALPRLLISPGVSCILSLGVHLSRFICVVRIISVRLQVIDGMTTTILGHVILISIKHCLPDQFVGVNFRKKINSSDSFSEYFFNSGDL